MGDEGRKARSPSHGPRQRTSARTVIDVVFCDGDRDCDGICAAMEIGDWGLGIGVSGVRSAKTNRTR